MASLNAKDSQLADANDKPLIGNRQAAITAASGTADGTYGTAEAAIINGNVTAINAIITALEAHGLIESND